MLISYLGVDFLNQGERVYRLLGCDLTYHKSLPKPGETLAYDIHVDSHATQGDIRLFFFHYDCCVEGEPRLTVRNGRVTVSSPTKSWPTLRASSGNPRPVSAVKAHASTRRKWPPPRPRLAAKSLRHLPTEASMAALVRVLSSVRPIPAPPGLLAEKCSMDEVTHLEHQGGPWGRGYLRAHTDDPSR